VTGTPPGAGQRIVIVGASLAGLRAGEALRRFGHVGPLTFVDAEDAEPYDRPPLSKQVLMGMAAGDRTRLPRLRDLGDATWIRGVSATGLDRRAGEVRLADGQTLGYDRLLVATGVRNRPWPVPEQAGLEGVFSVRTGADATRLHAALAEGPSRVLIIGGGFTGSEVASVCRGLGLDVTLVERGPAPLAGALGGVFAAVAADVQHAHGVDLRTQVQVEQLEQDGDGRVRGAVLSDGTTIDADVVVVALGALRNVEWLAGSGIAVGPRGVSADAGGRAFDTSGLVVDDVFAAGDVARFPHPVFEYQFLSLEHWENAVTMAEVVANNMVCESHDRVAHLTIPAFWSIQFGLNIKSVGVPSLADEVLFTQGSVAQRSFVVAYGRRGRLVAAVTVDQAKWLDFYRERIQAGAPLDDGTSRAIDGPTPSGPVPAGFPDPTVSYHLPSAVVSGHDPLEMRATLPADFGASA
jgi:NADPH-dependent 2,4-dienoyl-CoA reductase/sulfur reductase-like enzyme